ncbi:hypothetical protein [Lysobacter tyrosinilyticus]
MNRFDSAANDLTLLALMRIARNRCCGTRWEDIEPELKENWEVLRTPVSAPWQEVSNKLRSYCEDYGLARQGSGD